jgi:uncharacterized protein YdhG (YjbR/CyaY superfamily)
MPYKTVDEYLASVPDEARAGLEGLRVMIKEAAPGVTEAISYQIPTFKHKGRSLVGFAAAKDHLTFHVMSTAVISDHAEDVKGFKTGRGSVQFTVEKSLPPSLVTKLVQARIEELDKG